MNRFKRMVILLGLVLTLTFPVWGRAQTITNDDTTLKQIIVFGRHSVRSSTVAQSTLNRMAVDAFPLFEVQPGYLTPHGYQAEILLGTYFNRYLLHEGLLTGDAATDLARSYFRSNSIQRSNATAHAFGTGLIPNLSSVPVHSFTFGKADPVFDPILANVLTVPVDPARAAAEVQAIFKSGADLAAAYSVEYALIRSALFDYPVGTQPPPDTPPGKIDPTAQAITLIANTSPPLYTGGVIDMGGLATTNSAADPFVMQYTDGFPLDQVAWGRLTLDQLSRQTRIVNLQFDIEMLSPYLNKVQSSNAASHILRTMEQAVSGVDVPGAFGDAGSQAVVVISSDAYVAGLAGVLNMHWQLSGYQPDFCAPGGALVFELRQSKSTNKYLVRVFYTAQTFDQLRNLTPLTLEQPPATMQLFVPGGSASATDLDVDFTTFQTLMGNAIDSQYVEDPAQEPGVLPDLTTSSLLWAGTGGSAALWTFNSSNAMTNNPMYGPCEGWTPVSYSGNADGTGTLLWAGTGGSASLWTLNSSNIMTANPMYGPYEGWTPVSYSGNADGTGTLLWAGTGGSASLWTLDSSNIMTANPMYGPFEGWTPVSYSVNPGGTGTLVWAGTGGYAAVWTLDGTNTMMDDPMYGPYEGWTPVSCSVNPDGTRTLLWAGTGGYASLWTLDSSNTMTADIMYGPYSGSTPVSYNVNADGTRTLLWAGTGGSATLWTLDNSNNRIAARTYGPYSGWTPIKSR